MAIRLCPEIQFDAGSHEQVQRRFIDRRRPPALGRRMIMPRRVDMRSVMRAQCQHFAGPPLAIWQLFRGEAWESSSELQRTNLMVGVGYVGPHRRRVADDARRKRYYKTDKNHLNHPPKQR